MMSRFTLALLAVLAPLAWSSPSLAQKVFNDDRSFDRVHASQFGTISSVLGVMTRAMFFDAAVEVPAGVKRPASVKDPVCGCEFKENGSLAEPTRCEAMRGIANEDMAVVSTVRLMPVDEIVSHLMCFRSGLKSCEVGGVTVGGISCCMAKEDGVRAVARDPNFHIVAPLVLAQKLEGLRPGRAAPGSPQMCGFAYDVANGVFSVPSRFDGMLARMYVYANQRYGSQTPATLDVLGKISEANPPSRFELARERYVRHQIKASSEVMTPYIKSTRPSVGLRSIGVKE